MFPDTGKSLVD